MSDRWRADATGGAHPCPARFARRCRSLRGQDRRPQPCRRPPCL